MRLGDRTHRVPLREDADELRSFHDKRRPDPILGHHRQHLTQGRRRAHRIELRLHDLANRGHQPRFYAGVGKLASTAVAATTSTITAASTRATGTPRRHASDERSTMIPT